MNTENTAIKVIGIGSLGSTAINNLIEYGIQHVELSVIDTDTLPSNSNLASTNQQLEDADIGMNHANHECFNASIGGAGIVVFIVGGENSALLLASSVAKIARELDVLTIAMVTSPFSNVANLSHYSDEAISSLHEQADVLILMPKAGCTYMSSDGTSVHESCMDTLNSLRLTIEAIAGATSEPGLVNLDITDLREIMSNSGMAITSTAIASGQFRAKLAAEDAIKDMDITGARGVLVHITSSNSLKLNELATAMECIQHAAQYSFLLMSSAYDETIGDYLRVTVLATGLSIPQDFDYSSTSQC